VPLPSRDLLPGADVFPGLDFIGGEAVEGRLVNQLVDPGFESGVQIFDAAHVAANVVDGSRVVSEPALRGNYSLELAAIVNANPAANLMLVSRSWNAQAVVDQVWSCAALVGWISAGLTARLELTFTGIDGLDLLSTSDDSFTGSEDRLEIQNALAPPGTGAVRLSVMLLAQNAGATGKALFDDMMLVNRAQVPDIDEWWDGDSGGALWEGARFGSLSSQRDEDTPSYAQIKPLVPSYWYA